MIFLLFHIFSISTLLSYLVFQGDFSRYSPFKSVFVIHTLFPDADYVTYKIFYLKTMFLSHYLFVSSLCLWQIMDIIKLFLLHPFLPTLSRTHNHQVFLCHKMKQHQMYKTFIAYIISIILSIFRSGEKCNEKFIFE